jgi:hypothetical protein
MKGGKAAPPRPVASPGFQDAKSKQRFHLDLGIGPAGEMQGFLFLLTPNGAKHPLPRIALNR